MTILWNKRRTNVDFWSKCWFGVDNGDKHFYRQSLCEDDNPMKQEMHKCRFLIKMLIWPWQWRWALLQRILVREWQFYETRDAQMYIFDQNVDLALTLAMWERQRESLCENENSMSSFNQKSWLFNNNIDFSLEKCRFGRKQGLLHYVLRRKRVIFQKNINFELEICVKTKKGRTALQPQASLSLKC